MSIDDIRSRLKALGDPERAAVLQRFFKTGPGGYGEGDIFHGIRVPDLRKVAKEVDATVADALLLLKSPVHEERLVALLILIRLFSKEDGPARKGIFNAYLKNTAHTNSWDLVDLSADKIIGAYLEDKDRSPIYRLAKSKSVWERRMAMMATFHYIKKRNYADALKVAGLLLHDTEDLIHKAAGWMLREIGKRDMAVEKVFLKEHCKVMPRTMLRYAIERFPEKKRVGYLKGNPVD
ncbi:MAG: DNA alkylation repair protein [Deltaproteobacteria bacterium]|nr:DNA alkylation repair protein [Deltaproteobacteria bacterium]